VNDKSESGDNKSASGDSKGDKSTSGDSKGDKSASGDSKVDKSTSGDSKDDKSASGDSKDDKSGSDSDDAGGDDGSSGANGSGAAVADESSAGADGSSKSGAGSGYSPTYDGSSNNCMEDHWLDAGNKGSLVCEAKEVQLDSVTADTSTSCKPGEKITVTLQGSINFNADRYNPGFYIGTDGGDALTGSCEVKTFASGDMFAADNADLSCNGDDDPCCDIAVGGGGGTVTKTLVMDQQITCSDDDEDGHLDVSVCFSWSPTDDTCDPNKLVPGTKSKCACDRVNVANIQIDDTAVVGLLKANDATPYAKCE
jgi:hypothetical protein